MRDICCEFYISQQDNVRWGYQLSTAVWATGCSVEAGGGFMPGKTNTKWHYMYNGHIVCNLQSNKVLRKEFSSDVNARSETFVVPVINSTQLNSTQLYCNILVAEQLNSWIAKYSSICRPIHVQYNRIKSLVIQYISFVVVDDDSQRAEIFTTKC